MEFKRFLGWDVSARRPWEDALIVADEWELAKAVQYAWRQGEQDAIEDHRERQANA